MYHKYFLMTASRFLLKLNLLHQIRLLTFAYLLIPFLLNAQTVADTFDSGDIPTSFAQYVSSCNGPSTVLSVTLPSGGPWNVTSIDIGYQMTAQGGGLKSHQRSYIRCQNTSISEDSIYQGVGNTGGNMNYIRNGVAIANGNYAGGSKVNFEMRAWRTGAGPGCSTTYNRVTNFSWIITIHYAAIGDEGSVGIGTETPQASAILDLQSTTQAFLPPRMTTMQRNAIANPVPGMMIYNTTSQQLEIFTQGWSNLTFRSPGTNSLIGGTVTDICYSVQQTDDGGFIIGAKTNSSNNGTLAGLISNGGTDIWILKLDNKGQIQWQKFYGGSDSDDLSHLIQTSDGGYIAVGSSQSTNSGTLVGITNNGQSDYLVLKLDNNGNIVWQKLWGGSSFDFGHAIAETSEGDFIIAGSSASTNSGTMTGMTSNGGYDGWVIKCNSAGNIIWQKLIGGFDLERLYSIACSSDGGITMAGYSTSSFSGDLINTGNNGGNDYLLVHLNSSGNIIWIKLLGGSAGDVANEIKETSTGFIVVGGSYSSNTGTLTGITTHGDQDFWVLNLDHSGTILWQKLWGGTGFEYGYSLDVLSDEGFVVCGESYSSNSGNLIGSTNNGVSDHWIVRANSSGAILWQKLLGGSLQDIPRRIAKTNDGGVFIGGSALSSNTGTLSGFVNHGAEDIWIYKLDTSGNLY